AAYAARRGGSHAVRSFPTAPRIGRPDRLLSRVSAVLARRRRYDRAITRIGVVVGVRVPPAGSIVRPSLSPWRRPGTSTGPDRPTTRSRPGAPAAGRSATARTPSRPPAAAGWPR